MAQDSSKTITIKIGKVPGQIKSIALPAGSTVADALKSAQLQNAEGFQLRVNTTPVGKDTVLEDGQTVLLLTKVKGN
ncbi:MAG TPA: MoaD/ThiS family protein [Verrucomicrobiae bacterium]|nr:MoaD/ThiS family protein [Verrucomicrobiae bacterium]